MKQIKFGYNKVLVFIVAFLTLLISGTLLYSIEGYKRLRDATLVILFIVLVFLFFRWMKTTFKFPKSFVFIAVGTAIFFVGSFLSHPYATINLISKVLMFILFCSVFHSMDNAKLFFKYLYNIIVCISVIALVYFIGLYVIKIPLQYTTLSDGFYKSYFYLFYNASIYQEFLGSFSYYRLQAIFWEPGVYGIYIILALYYYTFVDEEKDRKKLYILVVCLLLTLSTTGMILGVFIIAILFFKKVKRKRTRIFIFAPLVILVAITVYIVWAGKVTRGGGYTASYTLRMVDFKASLKVWLNHFWFGTGYGSTNEFQKATFMWNRGGNSNGLLNWCMMMGAWGLFFQVLPFVVNILKSSKAKKIEFLVLAVVYMGINMTEPMITSPLMIMLLAFVYTNAAKQSGRKILDGIKRKKNSSYMS